MVDLVNLDQFELMIFSEKKSVKISDVSNHYQRLSICKFTFKNDQSISQY